MGLRIGRAAFAAVLVGGVGLAVGLAPSAPTAVTTAAEGEWTIDSVHSSVMFRILHMNTAYFYGRFNDLSGTIAWDDASPAASAFDVTIQTTSVDSKNQGRDKHLRGTDFFNTEQFPTATFKSTSMKPAGEGKVEVTGDLTLNGVTKPVTATVEKTGQNKGQRGSEVIGFETIFTIKRGDFGINFMPGGLGDEVKVFASFEAKKG